MALLGVGYIVGLNIAVLVFSGGLISWLFGIPIFTAVASPETLVAITGGATGYEAAEAIWRELAQNDGARAALSDLAALYRVMRQMNDGDPAALRGELATLTTPEAPYRFSALELLAALALREGDNAAAREHLTQITDDPAAPSGSRSRAAELLASLPG